MSVVEWKYAEPLSDDEDLHALEEHVMLPLPTDFRAFVREHNGALPKPNAISLSGGWEVLVNHLLRIESTAVDNLRACATALWQEHRAMKLLPFANDPFGNLFCFEYSGREVTGVVFWDHENGASSRVGSTFSEFVEALREGET